MTRLQVSTPAHLHHLHVDSPNPAKLAGFYAQMLGCEHSTAGDSHIMTGPGRAMIISPSTASGQRYAAYALRDDGQLGQLRERLQVHAVRCNALDDPLFSPGAFFVNDPQQRRVAFGVSARTACNTVAPARLQHTVFQTTELHAVVRFYVDIIGFTVSDEVVDDNGRLTVVFLRSDDEHHSLAFFAGSRNEWDHHCYETNEWNDIRDWADRFADAQVPIFFGPGRHGPGNNLFFMVTDPDGNRLEFSAELQTLSADTPPGIWPHGERTLNTWGKAWIRT